jgi:hypothetical protein
MDVKDVQNNINGASASSTVPVQSEQKIKEAIPQEVSIVDSKDLSDDRTVAVTLRNQKLEKANISVGSINVLSEQAEKISALLRSVAGITSQVTNASSDQVYKLQQEVTEIMAEIQKVGSGLRTTVSTKSVPTSVSSSSEQALETIVPEPPAQPPSLVLSTRAGVLMTRNIVAKAQAQFAALRESVMGATEGVKVETEALKRPSAIRSEDDAFRVSVSVAKEANLDPSTALGVVTQKGPSPLSLDFS